MVDTSELQIRTMEQLLEDFDGEVESALKMKNLIYTLFQRPSGPEDGSEVPVADQGGTQVDGVWSSDSGGPVLPGNTAIATDGDTTTLDGATITLGVSDGELTGATLPAASAVASNGDTVTVDGATVTLAVSSNDITGGSLPATSTVASDGDTVTVMDGGGEQAQATIAVGSGEIAMVGLAQSSECIVKDGKTTTALDQAGNQAPVAITVSGGAVSGVTIFESTDAIVSDGETPAVQGTGTTATLQVLDGVVTVILS